MIVIPAIDIIEGKCVRLTQGDYSGKKIYNENPLEAAKQFEDAGLTHLHLVDLDGAAASHIINWKILEKISSSTRLNIDFGGGIKSDDDIRIAFECGASQITGGSIAVKNKALFLSWLEKYGADKIILGADVRNERVAINGWKEDSEEYIFDFLNSYKDDGITNVICTDIEKDGMLNGPSLELYKKIIGEVSNINLIASGGISTMKDLDDLRNAGLYAAITGKAIYEKRISLKDVAKFAQYA